MANRLAHSTSPYLLQHADNPVAWWEWSSAALAEAERRDVPILLSVGYAACHWCHVMAHESFEDPATATVMNENFVCVKVDREERPDIDAVYMAATVAMTGQGGWPMTCFLTPDGRPFYCGTYYPDQPRHGSPAFTEVLRAIAEVWSTRRDEAERVGTAVRDQLLTVPDLNLLAAHHDPDDTSDAAVLDLVAHDFDATSGGFGGAPKFPPSNVLLALSRLGTARPAELVRKTLHAMARGGIYDQLRGGFSRYAVDAEWKVPHFEKMLYDNALLLRVYADAGREDPLCARIAAEIVDFLRADLRVVGGFAASLDADAAGEEGSTYVWSREQLDHLLGDDSAWAAELLDIRTPGNFSATAAVPQLSADPDDTDRWQRVRQQLLAARATRPQPPRDDKVVTEWNGYAITALVEAAGWLDEPEWLRLARDVADEVLDTVYIEGRLRRSSRNGQAGEPQGVLADYGALAVALLTLAAATGDRHYQDAGIALCKKAIELFADDAGPAGWFDTPHDAAALVSRPADITDGATPSGSALITEALYLASILGAVEHGNTFADIVENSLQRIVPLIAKSPRSVGHWWAVTLQRRSGLLGAVAETPASDGTFTRAVRTVAPSGAVVVSDPRHPLLLDRGPVGGRDAVYVCRGTTCDLPVTELSELRF